MGLQSRLCESTYPIDRIAAVVSLLVAAAIQGGCNQEAPPLTTRPQTETESPLDSFQYAFHRGEWQQAWRFSNSVLTQHPDDVETLAAVGRVAHEIGEPQTAADLMVDACHLESFANRLRLDQAAASLLAVGRIDDCMELFESSLDKRPVRHDIRRKLFDMRLGMEDRRRASVHGHSLVRHRKFDISLLLALSETDSRTESPDAFIEMAKRHPRDKRPLVASGRVQFDQGHLDEAADAFTQSLQHHPDYVPSLALLARVLVDAGRDSELAALIRSSPVELKQSPTYWLAVGDWCRNHEQPRPAIRAYWEAARRSPDHREAWHKLSLTVKQGVQKDTGFPAELAETIAKRSQLLSRFSQLKAEFVKTGKTSSAIAVNIAKTLQMLEQPWEAEAWASIAITLSPEADLLAKRTRDAIVAELKKNTPWFPNQTLDKLNATLSCFPLPDLGDHAFKQPDINIGADIAGTSRARFANLDNKANIKLTNQANARGLDFFGRTGDDLDRPGVKHYQILGCGGGTIDYDLDGWSDLYLAAAGGTPTQRNSASNSLWRNIGGTFIDVCGSSSTMDTGFSQGIAVGDVNEDGFPDLLVMNYGPNTLLINNGDGTFSDVSDQLDQDTMQTDWSSSGAIADLDGDGLADLTILTYGVGKDPVTRECRHESTNIARACSPLVFPGAADHFMKGSNDGNFIDQTTQSSAPSVLGRGLGLTVGSFDPNQGVDVFIANDLTSNHYWTRSTSGGFRFDESAIPRGLGSDDRSPAQGSMGIATGDFDGDGDADVYVTNFHGEANTYHEQTDAELWQDKTIGQDLFAPTLPLVGFGTEAIDLDNNGFSELVVSNGHVDQYPSDKSAPYAQPMQVFQRQSNGRFRSIGHTIEGSYLNQNHIGRALWTIDANRDGLTDLVVTHQSEPVALLMNETQPSGCWVEVKLVGRECSRDAIGATIQVRTPDRTWTAFQTTGDGYLCSNEQILRVGLGDGVGHCSITVNWPNGQTQVFSELAVQSNYLLTQGDLDAFPLID
ncbi:Repeat domain-containing protein [Neorhodopirellula lusitana]|uniref:Repeat domain-containing protein n=1 Tax=Neorhodopirellula lusitana TaxID=445327 RepID=A0ABY1QC66_9BACT|nr:FG-GAP-like repeat-containing protein [Neorhodopirellula lusitana]SMP66849.1 Repeat domain-containing protein [Neorhodopirellula lusitana]